MRGSRGRLPEDLPEGKLGDLVECNGCKVVRQVLYLDTKTGLLDSDFYVDNFGKRKKLCRFCTYALHSYNNYAKEWRSKSEKDSDERRSAIGKASKAGGANRLNHSSGRCETGFHRRPRLPKGPT